MLPDLPESTELGAWVLLGSLAFEVLAANVALKKKKKAAFCGPNKTCHEAYLAPRLTLKTWIKGYLCSGIVTHRQDPFKACGLRQANAGWGAVNVQSMLAQTYERRRSYLEVYRELVC